jgi:hypothetical protein
MSPVRYELGFYIPEDDILHSHCRENLESYISHNFGEESTFLLLLGIEPLFLGLPAHNLVAMPTGVRLECTGFHL